jgi:hypothetical protein
VRTIDNKSSRALTGRSTTDESYRVSLYGAKLLRPRKARKHHFRPQLCLLPEGLAYNVMAINRIFALVVATVILLQDQPCLDKLPVQRPA